MTTTTGTERIEIGDEVTFHGGTRGRHKGMQTGIVIGFHYKEFRGRRKELNQMFGGESGVEVLKVQSGSTIWKIGRSLVNLVRKAAVDRREAVESGAKRSDEIRRHNLRLRHQQESENIDAAEENGLHKLSIGSPIEVQLKSRSGSLYWNPGIFKGFVKGSGRVRVLISGWSDRRITTPAKFVRIPKQS